MTKVLLIGQRLWWFGGIPWKGTRQNIIEQNRTQERGMGKEKRIADGEGGGKEQDTNVRDREIAYRLKSFSMWSQDLFIHWK